MEEKTLEFAKHPFKEHALIQTSPGLEPYLEWISHRWKLPGEHGGLRRSRSALGRFLFRFLGAWQVAVAERAVGCGCKHTDVRATISETRGSLEDSGGCLVAPGRTGAAPDQ
ncbi:hypothetical protein NDU88_004997 [Pleurodeles waltl]|uniref:Uncharacterized protein n=1 Tax=Pleurodeles waltl TaxID=8319 RepID=A0AAV7TAQ4_PLEWA|nr:hypothetical protein NDU88_004997 [Pleurodeles waltl]